MKIELNIFTNCTSSAPSTMAIRKTHKSFCEVFGKIVPTIWCDPKPAVRNYYKYKRNLLKNYPIVNESTSLSDGYIKAINNSKADYLFMLEHDWQFQAEHINHSLAKIVVAMQVLSIYHLRFNKRTNKIKAWDKILEPMRYQDLDLCRTNILSNNPHIINCNRYKDFIKGNFIQVSSGSHGVEEIISKHPKTWGAIYGPVGHPATLKHSDGRKLNRRRKRK